MDIESSAPAKTQKKQYFKIIRTSNFAINGRFYMLDQASQDETTTSIITNKTDVERLLKDKIKRPVSFLKEIGHYSIFTMLEYYLEHHDVQQLYDSKQEEICSICRCELYDDSGSITYDKIVNSLQNDDENDVVKMNKCEGHFFHIGCLQNYINSQNCKDYLKCPNCCCIYGVMKGDQPEGTMNYRLEKKSQCSGYKKGTISIKYKFPDGKLDDGRRYRGTSRYAYLPNTPEGIEVLQLLLLSFERKLTFTVGTSVTTGRKDCVVWNGIHHKTNTDGGPTMYGYPDPTYFNRVKLELASKGIYPEEAKDIELDL